MENYNMQPPKKKTPKWLIILIVFFVLCGIGAFANNNSTSSSSGTDDTQLTSTADTSSTNTVDDTAADTADTTVIEEPTEAPEKPALELLSQNWQNGEYSSSIVGKVRNNSSETLSYAEITFNLYDKEGNQIGTALANINNLEPNGVWKYEATVLEPEKVDTYKMADLSGY